jgi:hypothetical protein
METQTNPLAESFIWGWILLAAGVILHVEIMAMIGPIMVAGALIGGAISTYVN